MDAHRAAVQDVGVDHRGLDVAVARQGLDGADVGAVFYNGFTSTKYRRVNELPPDFHSRFKPGRDPNEW